MRFGLSVLTIITFLISTIPLPAQSPVIGLGGDPSPKVIHGVSYSDKYPGADVAQRVNACVVDAETLANGNTSHVCNARGEAAIQSYATQITLGDSSFAAGATSVVVNTTAVTANSEILPAFDSSLGTALGVTCNTTPVLPTVSARTAGTSFTITVPTAPTTNPACFNYSIRN